MKSPATPTDDTATPPAAGGAAAYRTVVESDFDAVAALELWQHASTAGVLNHPAWWAAAITSFGRGRRLSVIRVVSGEATVALWPLWHKQLGPKELLTRILEPVGARVTDYCMPLLHHAHSGNALMSEILRATHALLDPFTILLLPKLPAATIDLGHLADCATALGLLCRTRVRPCPSMSLPSRYDELEGRWSKSHRGDVRRQIKRLRQAGRLELVTVKDRTRLLAMLPQFQAMHTNNWTIRSGNTERDAAAMTTFITRLAETLPFEFLEASEVHLDDIAISSHFGFRDGGRLLWYRPTFDVGWANYAPGKVHVALAAERSIAEGLDEFDFMQGNEPYKSLWCDLTTLTKSFALALPMAYPVWAWNTSVRRFVAEYRF